MAQLTQEDVRFRLHNLAYAVAKLGLEQGEAFRLQHAELFDALQAAEETLKLIDEQ